MEDHPRALVLQHDRDADAGLLGGWLIDREFRITEIRAPEVASLPDPRDFELVAVLGSSHCAADDLPWIAWEIELVRTAHEAGVPTLGICFGGQLLARALGGRVMPDRAAEIGWFEIQSLDREVISPGPWFEWHFDLLDPPPEAEILAVSECGVEAFRIGRSVGLQFHPEVDPEIVRTWARADPADLLRAGTDFESLLDGMGADPLDVRAAGLFDAIGKSINLK